MKKMMTRGLAVLLMASAMPAMAADPAKGKNVYESRCSFCHGVDGKGDGPAGAALQPKPTNFTEPSFWRMATPEMARMVVTNGKPGTAMVPFGQTLKPSEIEDVVAYLQTFK